MTLRTKETQQKYEQYLKENHLGCFLCLTDGDRIGEYWKIRENDFKYDQIYSDQITYIFIYAT